MIGLDSSGKIREDDSDNDDDEEEGATNIITTNNNGHYKNIDNNKNTAANTNSTNMNTTTSNITTGSSTGLKKCPVYIQTSYGVKTNTQIPHMDIYVRLKELVDFCLSHFDDIGELKRYLEKSKLLVIVVWYIC